jgi:hypothetical protein
MARTSDPIASTRKASMPNSLKVGTVASRLTSSSIDIRNCDLGENRARQPHADNADSAKLDQFAAPRNREFCHGTSL